MPGPPLRTAAVRYCIGCLLLVSAVAAVGVAAVDTSVGAVLADRSTSPSCEFDGYTPPRLGDDWTTTFEDPLAADSKARWDGGRIVRVGADGDCSLFVADGRIAALANVTVNGTRGIVTGTIDLGASGQFRLVDAAGGRPTVSAATGPTAIGSATTAVESTATGTATVASGRPAGGATTETNATGLVIANDGPDFSTTAVVTVGNRSETVALPSGRFFDVAVQRTSDGAVRVAVWEPDGSWDREWDVRFEDAGTAEWRSGLRGRAFLDGIAVGVPETEDAQRGSASTDGQAGSVSPDDEDDDWPGPGTWPGDGDDPDEPREPVGDGDGSEGSGDGSIFFGLILTVFGALGVKFAYGLAVFEEQIDAIGSKRRASEVEPAEWNVALTKIISGLVALAGLYLIATGLL